MSENAPIKTTGLVSDNNSKNKKEKLAIKTRQKDKKSNTLEGGNEDIGKTYAKIGMHISLWITCKFKSQLDTIWDI